MNPTVHMVCFSASYAIALLLEIAGLWVRPRWRRTAAVVAAAAGLTAHTWYLGQRAAELPAAPLSSPHDWYLAAAWMLAALYLAAAAYYARASQGLFLLPVVLGLIGVSRISSTAPLASFEAPRFWGLAHGVLLMMGSVAVLCGFVAGVMYLLQSYRLKRKTPVSDRFRLPSLEWLQQVNSRALGAAALLVGLGFFTGVVSRLAQAGRTVPWTDPVVLSLGGMLGWLIVAEAFRVVYPAARQGRKVAYLTLAAFIFLVITLASFTFRDSLHGSEAVRAALGSSPPIVARQGGQL